ncbi:acyltransferase [Candidatus Kaiserbacteria bacterium]|nr:acyltransferase [Candidatus Kaiserbacteria bacterium]
MSDRFEHWEAPEIRADGSTMYGWQVHPKHIDKLKLGVRTDIGYGTYIQPQYGVEIHDEVQIGSHCAIYSVSTIDGTHGRVVIGKGAKIGTHCSIMPSVTIGEGALIGAHSYVKSDIPAFTVAFGVPAKVVKKLEQK